MKRFALFLLIVSASLVSASPPLHHFGWTSNPHHAEHLTQFVHSPKFRASAPTADILDLSGCMPDSGTVPAPLAVHMPAIYDQGQEGSCTANAGTGADEFLWHKTFGVFIGGSRQGLYACELMHDGNWPSDAGSMTATVVWVLQNQGMGVETSYPYSTPLGTPLPDGFLEDAGTRLVTHAYDVDSTDGVSIQVALASGLPVMFGGYVYQSIETLSSGDYFNAPNDGSPIGGHERLIVGYNRTLKHTYGFKTVTGFYWVRNSWGAGWGCQGYCWEPMSEIENPQINEDFAVVDVEAVPATTKTAASFVPPLSKHDCNTEGHLYGPWFKLGQMFYIPEQPAHRCKFCGTVQNMSGRFMELVQDGTGPGQIPGGQGTLLEKDAEAKVDAEVLKDFGTWDQYKIAPVQDGFGTP